MPDRTQAEPKPFFWISLKGRPQKTAPPGHERFQGLSGWMEIEIEVVSDYLYVGSGQLELRSIQGREQVCYVFARQNETLIIPGTSLKGAIRGIVEALSNSCVRIKARNESVPSRAHEGCEYKKGEREALCPACRLFGTTGYRGRVHFADATPVGEVRPEIIKIADLWPPRQIRGRKFYQNKAHQRLDLKPAKNHRFLEAVPKGARFQTNLFFENLLEEELGLLARALGLDLHPGDPQRVVFAFPVKLGGAKPRCLGGVRFIPRRIRLLGEGSALFSSLLNGGSASEVKPLLARCLARKELLDQEAWERFRQEARSKDEPCPREVY
jgi:CRISPR/Cas system CSM-associated protein Csm3 (group 7 of RAMP superfamily)